MAKRWKWQPVHPSHRMRKAGARILAPCGTARFYGIRKCTKCEGEQAEHPAGRFMDDKLKQPCTGRKKVMAKKCFCCGKYEVIDSGGEKVCEACGSSELDMLRAELAQAKSKIAKLRRSHP